MRTEAEAVPQQFMEIFPKHVPPALNNLIRGLTGLLAVLGFGSVLAGTVVQFRTDLGNVDVELFDADKPVTVENFLRNVSEGRYAGTFFHELKPGSVVSGGQFRVSASGDTNLPSVRPAITNEFNVGPRFSNVAGTLAMDTDTADPNSATLKFFFNLKDNPELDSPTNHGGAVVFGRVIAGNSALTKLANFKPIVALPPDRYFLQTNCVLSLPPVLNNLPIYGFSQRPDFYEARVVMVEIELLRTRVSNDSDGRTRIRWNPVAGRTNTLEYSEVFPPVWQKLTDVPPTSIPSPVYAAPGGTLNLPAVVVDENAAPGRFYRVRATY